MDARPQIAADGLIEHFQSVTVERSAGAPSIATNGPAFRGIVGDIARVASAKTEAAPIAVLMTMLVWSSALFGRCRPQWVGDAQHYGVLFAALVGATSTGRKGTSADAAKRIMKRVDEMLKEKSELPFPLGRTLRFRAGGLSSSEGLIDTLRDATPQEEEDAQKNPDSDVDIGEFRDKRLMIIESEMSSLLKVAKRPGNTITEAIRNAWDGLSMQPMTKHNKICATDPHVCIVAHTTRDELVRELDETMLTNGLFNRFLWLHVERGQLVPFPPRTSDQDVERFARELVQLAIAAQDDRKGKPELRFTNKAADFYAELYAELNQNYHGKMAAASARGPAMVTRLAGIYARLDGAVEHVTEEHLEAAMALWRYSFDSVRFIFGNAETNPLAQRLLDFLDDKVNREANMTDIYRFFSGHITKPDVDTMVDALAASKRVQCEKRRGKSGRPPTYVIRID